MTSKRFRLFVCAVLFCAGTIRAQEVMDKVQEDSDVDALIRQLADTDYARRVEATQRLCALGMTAYDELKAAAEGDQVEAALRARHILEQLSSLRFAGCDVSLAFSQQRIVWDEPVDLILTVNNRSRHVARVPFELSESRRAGQSDDALHVGDFLDVADWLHVRDPSGDLVTLRVDDIAADPDVSQAVRDRLEGGPVSEVPPGQSVQLRLRSFNRGWARYPLLDAGTYKIQFSYAPAWDDENLASQEVGRIDSEEVTVAVTEGAPSTVARDGTIASMELERDDDDLVAKLINHTDLDLYLNLNYGPTPPFAQGDWVYESGEAIHEITHSQRRNVTFADFAADQLVAVPPGATLEIARRNIDTIRQALIDAGIKDGGAPGEIRFVYNNLADRLWQQRHVAENERKDWPAVLRAPFPVHLLATRRTTRPIAFPVDVE